MSALRFLFVFALFVFPFFVFAQDKTQKTDDAAKEKLRQETALLEQILADAKSLRLAENRAFVYAKVANALWQTDEKRARVFFQNSISDLITAQTEAEAEKGNKQYLNNLIYGQSPRWEILQTIGARDAEFALDAMTKTRPAKVAQAVSNFSGERQSPTQQYARNEIQNEQRLIALAAEQNPERAVKLLRESLKKDVSYETFNLLRKIFQKDPDAANRLAEEVAQRILNTVYNEDNQDTSALQNFLNEFGRKNTDETPVLKVSDQTLRSLAEKYAKFLLLPTTAAYYINSNTIETVEKYNPSSVAQLKRKQSQNQNQPQNAQSENYSKLMNGETTTEELLSQAEKFPRGYRNEIYRRAAEKTAQSGNVAEAEKIIAANFGEEESERYLSQINSNLANHAISQGKFNEASQFISQITEESVRLHSLLYLANSIYQKDRKENQKWATSVLDEARSLISDAPDKTSEMNSLVSVAATYAQIEEPAQAFRLIEILTAPLNEFSEAAAVIAKFSNQGTFRQGEYQLNSGNNTFGVYNLTNLLQTLKTNDFDRTMRFVNAFSRLDARISLQIQLVDWNLSINRSIQNLPISGRQYSNYIIDK